MPIDFIVNIMLWASNPATDLFILISTHTPTQFYEEICINNTSYEYFTYHWLTLMNVNTKFRATDKLGNVLLMWKKDILK